MEMDPYNKTKVFHTLFTPTLIWCVLMPLIHLLSLLSNILCIIVFCSKTFIHKPIAIYFICLLISDSITLLIGYSEMLDRESSMIESSSLLCTLNGRIIHKITDFIYAFMGKFCLEWMLYKVLWTRASTILLAILSIQRSRTFFSISYHESRFCAFFACLISISIALLITCFEWIGIQCEKPSDSFIYWEMIQSIMKNNCSKEFYSKFLTSKQSCLIQLFNNNKLLPDSNQPNCSTKDITSEFYTLTQSLLTNRDVYISENLTNILYNIYDNTTHLLTEHIHRAKSPDLVIKLFEKRSCHITLFYSVYLKFYDFLHSISFAFNRHTIAIFFGNALPSFIVVLANLLSLKVIYCSKSLQYLKQRQAKNRRHRRLQNDLRAFLVILIESFSVITISWGIPIFLTLYHCQTLYVISMHLCPNIQKYLAVFLFTDLFNSSTNCLLYSLSGKLFRRKFIEIIKIIFTCGRSVLWNVKPQSMVLPSQQIELQPSNEHSTILHGEIYPRYDPGNNSTKQLSKKKRVDDNASSVIVKDSDQQDDIDEDLVVKKLNKTRRFKRFLFNEVQLFGPRKRGNDKKKRANTSYSSSSSNGAISNRTDSQRQQQQHYSLRIISNDNRLVTKEQTMENMTNL